MHELAVTESILSIALRHAEEGIWGKGPQFDSRCQCPEFRFVEFRDRVGEVGMIIELSIAFGDDYLNLVSLRTGFFSFFFCTFDSSRTKHGPGGFELWPHPITLHHIIGRSNAHLKIILLDEQSWFRECF